VGYYCKWKKGICDTYYPCKVCPHSKITNADRIRAMSDEELANLFVSAVCVCPRGKNPDLCYCDLTCLECVSEWLKQPAEEVHHD
jgi:hypothetical protein